MLMTIDITSEIMLYSEGPKQIASVSMSKNPCGHVLVGFAVQEDPKHDLGINQDPVTIKTMEASIIDKAFEEVWMLPRPPKEQHSATPHAQQGEEAAAASAVSTARDFPADVLRNILQQQSLKDRIGSCSLVNSNWRAAAVAAPCSLHLNYDTPTKRRQLEKYMQSHGQRVTSLKLTNSAWFDAGFVDYLPLPCPKLLQLELKGLREVDADDEAGYFRVQLQEGLSALTTLTKLVLTNVLFSSRRGQSDFLQQLTGLKELHWSGVSEQYRNSERGLSWNSPIGAGISHLMSLTSLSFMQVGASDATLAHLSCLSNLKQLAVAKATPPEVMRVLHALPQLTALHVVEKSHRWWERAQNIPSAAALSSLTELKQLYLHCSIRLSPAVLVNLKQLQHLDLGHRVKKPQNSQMPVVLAALDQLSHLRHLSLPWYLDYDYFCTPEAAAAYSSLTKSGELTYLGFSCQLVPRAWQHIFAWGGQLEQLRALHVEGMSYSRGIPDNNITIVARCCPNLQQLSLRNMCLPAQLLHDLQQLTQLTKLALSQAMSKFFGPRADFYEVVPGLSTMTWLRELDLKLPCGSATALQPLTCLHQLQRLRIWGFQMYLSTLKFFEPWHPVEDLTSWDGSTRYISVDLHDDGDDAGDDFHGRPTRVASYLQQMIEDGSCCKSTFDLDVEWIGETLRQESSNGFWSDEMKQLLRQQQQQQLQQQRSQQRPRLKGLFRRCVCTCTSILGAAVRLPFLAGGCCGRHKYDRL